MMTFRFDPKTWTKRSRLLAIGLLGVFVPSLLQAAPEEQSGAERRAQRLIERDADLAAARETMPECSEGCITPVEATALAFSAGEGRAVPGRFILDVLGGGRSRFRADENLYFLNSQRDYSAFGVLVLAFDRETMRALLFPPLIREPQGPTEGQIVVEADRPRDEVELSEANMMRRFRGERIIVDGSVSLQWIRSGYGAAAEGRRHRREEGYYQVWIRVSDPAQVIAITDPEAN